MQGQRTDEFARCAVALSHALREVPEDGDPFVDLEAADISSALVGSEGLFDQALTSGLVAIVASEPRHPRLSGWPPTQLGRTRHAD
jgi:hypothetical protein